MAEMCHQQAVQEVTAALVVQVQEVQVAREEAGQWEKGLRRTAKPRSSV